MRIVTSVIISKGDQHLQTITLGRKFLDEAKPVAVSVFKRHANIGGQRADDLSGNLQKLAQSFVMLMCLTGYVEVSLILSPKYGWVSNNLI